MKISTIVWIAKSVLGLSRNIPASQNYPILIVEDNQHDADLLGMFCEKFGARFIKTSTLKDARELLLTQRFRLMFIDEHMKDGSGLQFIDEITPRCPNLPVSIVTGDTEISRRLWSGRNWSIILKGTHGGALMGAVENAILTANGVNGHVQPPAVVITTWGMCAASFVMGIFYRELPGLVEALKGINQ